MIDRPVISFSTAIERIMEHVVEGQLETVPILDAHQRYLGEEIIATHALPPFDRSAMDGYAIIAEDTEEASFINPKQLQVIEGIGAGEIAQHKVRPGTAIRVMTGASLPEGANAVVMLELVKEKELEGQNWIEINRPISVGKHISVCGGDTPQGKVLASKGKKISAGEMSLLAAFGYTEVQVYKRPKVGILATGSELLAIDEPLQPGKIRNTNAYMLISQLTNVGAFPQYYGIVQDDAESTYQAIVQALEEVDFLITTGGVSIGDYDFLPEILSRLEAEVLFNKIAIRPGSVTTVAKKNNKWIFGLSGNPGACFVGFELFVRPILKKSLGAKEPHLPQTKARLAHELHNPSPFTRFIRAKAVIQGSEITVHRVGLDKAEISTALVEANVLVVLAKESRQVERGAEVDVLWLEEGVLSC